MPSISLYEAIEEAVIEHVMQVAAGDAGPHTLLVPIPPDEALTFLANDAASIREFARRGLLIAHGAYA